MNFICEQSFKADIEERLLGSSEIIESLNGSFKQRLSSQSSLGFTGGVLMIPALLGEISIQIVHNAMLATSVNDLQDWSSTFIGSTIQKKRRHFNDVIKGIPVDTGTVNGNIASGNSVYTAA